MLLRKHAVLVFDLMHLTWLHPLLTFLFTQCFHVVGRPDTVGNRTCLKLEIHINAFSDTVRESVVWPPNFVQLTVKRVNNSIKVLCYTLENWLSKIKEWDKVWTKCLHHYSRPCLVLNGCNKRRWCQEFTASCFNLCKSIRLQKKKIV